MNLLGYFAPRARADLPVLVVLVWLRVHAVCGVFVSGRERPAPVINGVPVRHCEAPYTITAPDCSPARLVLHTRRRERREGGRVEWKIFPRCPLLSPSSPPAHPSCFSLRKLSTFTTTLPFFSVLSLFRWPLFNCVQRENEIQPSILLYV